MKNFSFSRAERIKKVVHKEIASLLQEMKDPRCNLVTITEVEISPDLTLATVYYMVHNSNLIKETEEMFNKAKGFIRTQLAQKLKLKKALEIKFVYDKFLEKTQRVLMLLDKIKDENNI